MVEKNFSSIGQSVDRLSIFELSIEFSIGTVTIFQNFLCCLTIICFYPAALHSTLLQLSLTYTPKEKPPSITLIIDFLTFYQGYQIQIFVFPIPTCYSRFFEKATPRFLRKVQCSNFFLLLSRC